MSVFADSSALVKLYADESGHEAIRAIAAPMVVSQVARVEVPAAVWRKQRLGELAAEDARLLVTAFEFDLFGVEGDEPRFLAVTPTAGVLDAAARLVAVHGLRAYDGIQLATATTVRAHAAECATLAALETPTRRRCRGLRRGARDHVASDCTHPPPPCHRHANPSRWTSTARYRRPV